MKQLGFKYLFVWAMVLVSSLCAPNILYAQQEIVPQDIGIQVTPNNPAPLEEVELRLESFSTNIHTAYISWFINAKQVQAGVGMSSYSFTMGPSGSVYDIEVRIRTSLLNEISKRMRLSPLDIDLLWETTDVYTPPFYRGKALPSSESTVRVVATPHNIAVTPQRFVYSWKYNGATDQKASGFQKKDFLVKNDFFSSRFVVDVDVQSQDGRYSASKSLIIPRFEPQILFELKEFGSVSRYPEKNTPIILGDGASSLIAHPLFFSTRDGEAGMNIQWNIAGSPYFVEEGTLPKNYIPLVPQAGATGSSMIKVNARHNERTLQKTDAETTVLFRN